MTRERALQLRAMIEKASVSLPDEDALEAVELFQAWAAGAAYEQGQRIRYGEKLYRCEQAHTSQADWTPEVVPALWAIVSLDEWPEWRQPTGAEDAYPSGAKVSHNDKRWISTVDANVWEPGVYGWEVNV